MTKWNCDGCCRYGTRSRQKSIDERPGNNDNNVLGAKTDGTNTNGEVAKEDNDNCDEPSTAESKKPTKLADIFEDIENDDETNGSKSKMGGNTSEADDEEGAMELVNESNASLINFELLNERQEHINGIKQMFIDETKGTSIKGALERIDVVKTMFFSEDGNDMRYKYGQVLIENVDLRLQIMQLKSELTKTQMAMEREPKIRCNMKQLAVAEGDFKAETEEEISFNCGDQINVLCECNKDRWIGSLNGNIGYFPPKNVTMITKEADRSSSTQRDVIQKEGDETENTNRSRETDGAATPGPKTTNDKIGDGGELINVECKYEIFCQYDEHLNYTQLCGVFSGNGPIKIKNVPSKKYAYIKFADIEAASQLVKTKNINNEFGVRIQCYWSNYTRNQLNSCSRGNTMHNVRDLRQHKRERTFNEVRTDRKWRNTDSRDADFDKYRDHGYKLTDRTKSKHVENCNEYQLHITIVDAKIGEGWLTKMVLHKFSDIFTERDIVAIQKNGPDITFVAELFNVDPWKLDKRMNEYLLPKEWKYQVVPINEQRQRRNPFKTIKQEFFRQRGQL